MCNLYVIVEWNIVVIIRWLMVTCISHCGSNSVMDTLVILTAQQNGYLLIEVLQARNLVILTHWET